MTSASAAARTEAGGPVQPLLAILPCAGLAVGSFIGLASLRMPAGEPFVLGRSACRGCGRVLGPRALVPLVSFALQRGRCVACGSAIPWRYPLIELAAAGIGGAAALAIPTTAPFAALLGWWLLLLGVLDYEHLWLPRVLTWPLTAVGLGASLADGGQSTIHRAIGATVGYVALAGLAWAYRRLRGRDGLGGGDAALAAAAGAWVGWQGLPWVLFAAAWGGLAFVALTALRRRWTGDSRLAFGCFLAPAIWLVYLLRP